MFLLIEYSGIHTGEPVSTCLLPGLQDVSSDELERKYKLILSAQKVTRWEGMGESPPAGLREALKTLLCTAPSSTGEMILV